MNEGNRVFDQRSADPSHGRQEGDCMAKEVLAPKSLAHLLQAVAHLVQLPKTQMWLDYDEEADVLYIHFEKKPSSTHSELRDDGVILDYRGNRLVGVTVLEASRRNADRKNCRKLNS
jgi:uncharacterized protein YuzE